MADSRAGFTLEPKGAGSFGDTDDLGSSSAGSPAQSPPPRSWQPATSQTTPRIASRFAVDEVAGDAAPSVGTESDAESTPNTEVGNESTESGEEFAEATAEQLAGAESGQESATSDLRGIEGFEEFGAESGEEGAIAPALFEAGAVKDGQHQEFLPFLAALAPTLISSIGPAVAKGVMRKLSPKAKRLLKRLPRPPIPAGAVSTLVRSATAGRPNVTSMLGVLAKLLESAEQMPGGESGMEVDESFITEAAAAMEVIIGTDDRIRITATTQIPWRRICALRITFPSGATYRGSGFLIGPRAVATAGHCVYLHNQGGWARQVEVIPGCNGTGRPFGQATSTTLRSVAGWVTRRKPESDYGCVVLPAGAFSGRSLGSFGFAAFNTSQLLALPAVVAGYPGDKPFAELWGMARRLKAVTSSTLIYDIDTVGGQSGAPVYIKRNGVRYVVGIHNYGASTGNSATRVTLPVYERLLAWSKIV